MKETKVEFILGHIAVEFGGGGGFAHIVENSERFPPYFMREILGGHRSSKMAKTGVG